MKRVKLILATVSAASILMCGPITSLAEEGWTQEDGDWKYLAEDNSTVTESWRKGNEFWYYLDGNGRIVKDTFLDREDSIYYLDDAGKMTTNGWVEKDGRWYYFGDDGKAFKRTGNKYKFVIEGKSYAFSEEGIMLTGWLDEEGQYLEDADEWLTRGVYYAGDDGALFTDQWVEYLETSKSLEDRSTYSEAIGRDYSDNTAMWMYLDKSSKKVTGKADKLVQKDIGDATYGFDENGVMNQGWGKVAISAEGTQDRPLAETPPKFYSGYDGGGLVKNSWIWMYPSENLDAEEYRDQECSWWFTDSEGKVVTNRIKTINGKDYALDGIGRMQTGFVFFDGRTEFIAQYDVDAWESQDFIYGNIYADDRADLYFFNTDELNDGSMQAGKEVQIQLADGTFTFGFADNGKVLGARNKLQKKNDHYYINGLRLDADPGYNYGVVQISSDGKTRYQVVDKNGKVVSGKQKILTDKDGGYLLIVNDYLKAYVIDDSKPKWRTGDEGTGFYHYDKDNKDDPYAGGLIAGSTTEPSADGLLPEQKLNFD